MMHFVLEELLRTQSQEGEIYHEFLREDSMSVGIYQLAAGAVDGQQPHTEDEMYVVLKGSAQFYLEEENIEVKAGSILFVKAHAKHHFHSITEDLTVMVIFSPAEYSLRS
ncbi:MAG TPA: cupin domain-containing protein [Candidatus Bathyarchaeia archaeon]|nr:cupin domain-containing protein [Candidatus Bathyarchaeia archaeon]